MKALFFKNAVVFPNPSDAAMTYGDKTGTNRGSWSCLSSKKATATEVKGQKSYERCCGIQDEPRKQRHDP
ncbi:MAG: hypothetical protein GY696_28380 [Gammaproteobacteria bacterium]|nr:hypothetical protein [Gammaproteobacteria bacterium]